MNLINDVFDLAEEFMSNPRYVDILDERIDIMAADMLETGITPFPLQSTGENFRVVLMKELVASSINYCYWYGKHDIRPGGCGSGLMYDLVNKTFNSYGPMTLKGCIHALKGELALHRFPLLEERIRHLTEVATAGEMFITTLHQGYVDNQCMPEKSGYKYYKMLVEMFPGFASDLFLKRTSLFFLQIYRQLGWYDELMETIQVPSDYQVPKLLKHFGCFRYFDPLKTVVKNNNLIPKNELLECEIRAATIVVCKELQRLTKWNISDIDGWLWLRRKGCNDPFHLTITTDY